MFEKNAYWEDLKLKPIGQQIKSARKAQNVTRSQLEKMVDCSASTIKRIEKSSDGKYCNIQAICEYLKIPMFEKNAYQEDLMCKPIGKRIRTAREVQNVTQFQLSEEIGHSVKMIQGIEENDNGRYSCIQDICTYLKIPMG